MSERATSVLREQKPEVQEMVLGGPEVVGERAVGQVEVSTAPAPLAPSHAPPGAKDMSASCMGRIRKAQQAASRITSSSVRRVPRRSRTPRSGRASLSEAVSKGVAVGFQVVQAVGSSLNRGARGWTGGWAQGQGQETCLVGRPTACLAANRGAVVFATRVWEIEKHKDETQEEH